MAMQQPLNPAFTSAAAAAARPNAGDRTGTPYPGNGPPPDEQPVPVAATATARKTPSKAAQIAIIAKRPDFLVTWIAPWVVFSFLACFYTYGFMQLPSVCVIITVLMLAVSFAFLLLRQRSHVWLPLGVTLLVATITGSLVGLYLYDSVACFPEFYANSRPYADVQASEPADAVADAGKIVFSNEAGVDTNRSVAFVSETGAIYCAAPVVTMGAKTQQVTIQFWAVGLSCCASMGDFTCDDATDSSARGGVRVFDNSGFFSDSRKDFYNRARLKAEATYGLVSTAQPMYVRWVKESQLDFLSNEYSVKALGSLLSTIMLYALASSALAYAVYQRK